MKTRMGALCAVILSALFAGCGQDGSIDRKALLERNNPTLTQPDTLSSLTVGNGGFAFTVDATGLQTFPEEYSNGVPLGTQSDWGWHSFANPDSLRFEETLIEDDMGYGCPGYYCRQIKDSARGSAASNWYRANPHRMHLGTVGLDIPNTTLADIENLSQRLDLRHGIVESAFRIKENDFEVRTACHPDIDMIATEVISGSRTPFIIRFPYPTGLHSDDACNWMADSHHSTELISGSDSHAVLQRHLDSTTYFVCLKWEDPAILTQRAHNTFVLTPTTDRCRLTCQYAAKRSDIDTGVHELYAATIEASSASWETFWDRGAAVDFSRCTDCRAPELERRVVLSQYLLAANCAGDTPPQETGLTYNSWFGKFHLEMIYWHQAWLPLWNHADKIEHTLEWYAQAEANARNIARRQGFRGVRWMKMTDPSSIEAPSNVGSYLIWQQPHLIHLADLIWRTTADTSYLSRMGRLIDETAEFMADFVVRDSLGDRYVLRGFIPAQETLSTKEVVNAPFEVAYWTYGLQTAQLWREHRGLPRCNAWDEVIDDMPTLAYNADSLYLAAETAVNTYSDIRFTSDHPAVLGALGVVPQTALVDQSIMRKTLMWIMDNWNWNKTWGWDYPMVAMCATRLNEPSAAIDALLMDRRTNTYLPNGHNYQDKRLRCYLPGNGGLLTCVALMCAGWDCCGTDNPGFPKDGTWDVRWEGLKRLP